MHHCSYSNKTAELNNFAIRDMNNVCIVNRKKEQLKNI